MFHLVDTHAPSAVIKVIGVGGGGGNAVQHMIAAGIEGVEFICANTDAQSLRKAVGCSALHMGANVTRGLGAGTDPEKGRKAALEDSERIREVVAGADMVFITAGMGGGTGTGAAPVIAQIAKEAGALTVAVVTKPFPFEGPLKMKVAGHGIGELAQHVDSIITIPNEKLALLYPKMSILDAFKNANNVLLGAVQGIAELITQSGVINVDFADVRTVMSEMGLAMMGSGAAAGPDRAREAAEQAIHSPLLEDVDIKGARGVLVNVKGGPDLAMDEFQAVGDMVREFACEDAKVKVGLVIDPDMTEELRVTMVVTGIGAPKAGARQEAPRMQVVQGFKKASGDYDYATLEKPAYIRQLKEEAAPVASVEARLDYLDIPAFLRRQAD